MPCRVNTKEAVQSCWFYQPLDPVLPEVRIAVLNGEDDVTPGRFLMARAY